MSMENTDNIKHLTEPDITVSQIYMVISQTATGPWKHQSVEPYHRLMLTTKGSLNATIMGQNRNVKAYDIMYVPKNTIYKSQKHSKEVVDHTCILFDCADIPAQELQLAYFHTPDSPDKYIQLFRNCQTTFWSATFGYKLKSKMILYDLLRSLYLEQFMPNNMFKYYNGIKPAIKYINDRYASENINIARLAELCNITTTHLSRTFKAIYGTTPVKYINNLRIEKAIALLNHTSLSIAEISEQTGFSDPSYFSKTFKKIHGQSPLDYKHNK